MALAIPIASAVLRTNGFADAIVSVVAIIVGLHLFGLVRAFESLRFAAIGGAMCLLGVVSLGLPARILLDTGAVLPLRETVVGIGCVLVLWGSVLAIAIPTWRDMTGTRTRDRDPR